MASTHLTSADDSSSSSSSSSSTKEAEQKASDVQPQKPTVVSAGTSLEQQPTNDSSSPSNGTNGGKRTMSTSANNDDAGASVDAKRHRPNDKVDEVKNDKKEDEKNEEVLDFARTLGLVDGDRLQVKWEIVQDNDDNDDDNDENSDSTTATATTTTRTTHWWTATLLPHDGRVVDENVAIRTLSYDPYPDGGFPERSVEDVVFLGPDLLVDPVTRDDLRFRRLGETHDIDDDDDIDETDDNNINICIDNREDLERIVNETLANALANQAAKWQSLSVAQQAHIASTVAEKKEVLLTLLEQHQGVITAPVMQQLLAQAMSMPSSASSTASSHHY